jgi:hypothetical protein
MPIVPSALFSGVGAYLSGTKTARNVMGKVGQAMSKGAHTVFDGARAVTGFQKSTKKFSPIQAFTKQVDRVLPDISLTGAEAHAHEKLVNRSVQNLYLGRKLNVPTDLAVGVIAGGAALATSAYGALAKEVDGDPSKSMAAQAGLAPRLSGPPDLGASGDLVLALNRRR